MKKKIVGGSSAFDLLSDFSGQFAHGALLNLLILIIIDLIRIVMNTLLNIYIKRGVVCQEKKATNDYRFKSSVFIKRLSKEFRNMVVAFQASLPVAE